MFYISEDKIKTHVFFLFIEDKRKIIDFKSMTRHLRKKAKEENNTQTIDQLNIIDNIRRELMRSSSGVLGKKKFKDNMECIRKVYQII